VGSNSDPARNLPLGAALLGEPMARALLLTALAALLVPTAAHAAGPAATPRPPAKVVLLSCERSVHADERRAIFEARMRRIAGAELLQMRFSLRQRAPLEAGWRTVATEGWHDWLKSDPGVAEYRYTREVARLTAPAAYRAVVRFRWLDADGDVVAHRRARSPVCRQADLRPDLRVDSIAVRPAADPAQRRYLVTVRNDGRARAGANAVALTVDRLDPVIVALEPLGAGRSRVVEVLAPRCTPGAGGISALADAFGKVDEARESDNRLVRACVA
jgi:hypothetical protein